MTSPTPGSVAAQAQPKLVEPHHLTSASLISVAGLRSVPVLGPDGDQLGSLADVVVRSEAGHPQLYGLLAQVGTHRLWVPIKDVGEITQRRVQLSTYRLDLKKADRRPGEIFLIKDVIDHQVVDVHGVRVLRASDIYITSLGQHWRLVGVDVSLRSYLRRALGGSIAHRPSPNHVLDWAGVRPLAVVQGALRLDRPQTGLHLLRPSELADLLDELGRLERLELLETLSPEEAVRALELMTPEDVLTLIRSADRARAAALMGVMDREHAAGVLRRMPAQEREEILAGMEPEHERDLRMTLAYEEWTAGGLMTGGLVVLPETASVGEAVEALHTTPRDPGHPAVVAVVDAAGRLVDDISVFELLGVPPERPIAELIGSPWPVTVEAHENLRKLIATLEDSSGSSVVVVDQEMRPLGRVVEHDVMQALLGAEDRRWPWQRQGWIQP